MAYFGEFRSISSPVIRTGAWGVAAIACFHGDACARPAAKLWSVALSLSDLVTASAGYVTRLPLFPLEPLAVHYACAKVGKPRDVGKT